jgi:hypothetical protein
MVPPSSDRIPRVPPYLICELSHFVYGVITLYDQSFQIVPLFDSSSAVPLSLAATQGISVDFFSSGYLDVSVLPVRFNNLCIQLLIPLQVGFPIRISPVQCLFDSSPRLFAAYHVLLRLLSPRHPPYALNYLTI